ncbi:MAG TPA: nucleotide sugar dehydrogenase [Methanothrix soehngenii]|nr:nucleotide sugar dehydrogenase [Methanothrix soehngenii]
MATVTVIGLGYVGLPLAIAFKSKGFNVFGYDTNAQRVKEVAEGKYPFSVDTSFCPVPIKTTTNPSECLPKSDFVIICVPTPLTNDNEPNLKYLESAAKAVKTFIKSGQIIIIESTTYPGTTEEFVKPILEESGLSVGIGFGLAYSPERIDPGNKLYPLERIPKIVGASDENTAIKVRELYENIIDTVVIVDDIKTAEAVKIVENIFRAVNISLVNELALLFEKMGINSFSVIKAAATKPFGFMPFYPGPGVGGHCIPVDPFYLSWKAKQYGMNTEFIELAGKLNQRMPMHVIELIENNANKNQRVLVLGVAYKKNVSDTRNSPARPIIKKLLNDNWNVGYFDPYVKEFEGLNSEEDLNDAIKRSDCILLITDHDYFRNILNLRGKIVIDTRDFFDEAEGVLIGLGK